MKSRLFLIAASLAASLAASTVLGLGASAYAASNYPDNNSSASSYKAWNAAPEFLSETDLINAEYNSALNNFEQRYGLKRGFTAAEFGEAQGIALFQELRKKYNLGPDFSFDELVIAIGTKSVQERYGYLNLPPNFTIEQARHAMFVEDTKWIRHAYPDLPVNFSYDEYVKATGAAEALELASHYALPTNWVHADLVAAVGPMEAGTIRQRVGYERGASHDEIVAKLGKRKADWFAKDNSLPAHFTAQDVAAAAPVREYSALGQLAATATETDVAKHLAEESIKYITRQYGLPATFNSVELRQAMGQSAIADKVSMYDVDNNFTEFDLARASAVSEAMRVRLRYKLRADFSAAEYKAAYEAAQAKDGNYLRSDLYGPY